MISSRCRDAFAGKPLSAHRVALEQAIEAARIFGQKVFEVWINERAGPAPATLNWWEWCLGQARDCDLMVVLYNGCSGSALMQTGGVGICHAEFAAAMAVGPDKVRVIQLDPVATTRGSADQAFRDDLARTASSRLPRRTAASSRRRCCSRCLTASATWPCSACGKHAEARPG